MQDPKRKPTHPGEVLRQALLKTSRRGRIGRAVRRERRDLPATVPQDEWLIEQLRDPDTSVAYLNAALTEGDQAAFMLALRNVAKARGGVAMLARRAELNRVALSRTLSVTGNPELRNLTRILDASGLKFVIAAKEEVRLGGAKRHEPRQKGGEKRDAAHLRSRRRVPFGRGVLKSVKRAMSKRARKYGKRPIRAEL